MVEPVFLDPVSVGDLHQASLLAYGGSRGVRDQGTGVGAALLFLQANGIRKVPDDLQIYDALIAVAEKRLDNAGLAALFRNAAHPVG